ncbi:MAG TPA: MFS transporter, partial [Mycobacteriales bacterium]|nr:MFS transporter [Mycobacteriales bacterium]
AGLQLVPLMAGIITTSAVVGVVMRRTGRYRAFPVAGTLVLMVAMLLFARLEVTTPLWQVLAPMVVLGAGLGLCMQTLVISVQNALPPRDMGVATSSVTFFRSMGGTFGAAAALAVLFGSLASNVQARLLAAGVPAEVVERFGSASALDDSTVVDTLPEPVRTAVLQGFTDSVQSVFAVVAVVLVPAFLLSLLLREVPLRTQGGLAAAQADVDAETAARTTKTETAVL